jgi:hypothetical protein
MMRPETGMLARAHTQKQTSWQGPEIIMGFFQPDIRYIEKVLYTSSSFASSSSSSASSSLLACCIYLSSISLDFSFLTSLSTHDPPCQSCPLTFTPFFLSSFLHSRKVLARFSQSLE